MKILTDYEELNGKKIVFSHMAEFAEQITLGAEDGCILMVTFDITDFEEQRIRVFNKSRVLMLLNSDKGKWLREELSKLGIFDLEKYKKEQAEIKKIEDEKRRVKTLERERIEYERLQKKFES